ncbi:MAG: hypothetical protein HXS52_13715 [Theionarchaea archaeon]|nr:hypothetical protein [Theionarchaea archaeon]MBU7038980.1 hypothetical protein [Theionarchaea archaeon]
MKKFVSGLLLGIGIGLLVSGLLAGTIVTDAQSTLTKYETHIDDFYSFTHSYSFQTLQNVMNQTVTFYTNSTVVRETLETLGMGQLGQMLLDIDDSFQEVTGFSEDLYNARSTVEKGSTWVSYMRVIGILLIAAGALLGLLVYYRNR